MNNVFNLLKYKLREFPTLNCLNRWYNFAKNSKSLYPNWKEIISNNSLYWNKAHQRVKNDSRILIATSTGGHLSMMNVESLFAVALTIRAYKIDVLLCDSFLPACLLCEMKFCPDIKDFAKNGAKKYFCKNCFSKTNEIYKILGIQVRKYSELIEKYDIENVDSIVEKIPLHEIDRYQFEGVSVGEHAMAGTMRFFARGSLREEKYSEHIIRLYLKSAMLTTFIIKKLISLVDYRCAVFHHGIYVPQGIIGEILRKNGVRVVNWNPAYKKGCFIFSHENTYHHTLMTEPVEKWENLALSGKNKENLFDYLKSRWNGTQDWIWFHEKPKFDLNFIIKKLRIDPSKPWIGLLTNVVWDAQLHYPTNVFPNMIDWIVKTIGCFSKKKDIQLIIRIHPAEIRGTLPTRQRVDKEVKNAFPILPNNIFVVSPEDSISTYTLMSKCSTVIIYGTKTGVELVCSGIPVVVAGEAWIKNKGLTVDPQTRKEYFEILDRLPQLPSKYEAQIERAYKYAYHFFFRRMIPLRFMQPIKGWLPYQVKVANLKDLEKGNDIGLDIICDGIIDNKDFIYPAEDYAGVK